uniref:Uncharacterized protein n=1 Tax=viral metagenome TaxID=1070528 RepID=A0A6M3LLS7_9ZZZZ
MLTETAMATTTLVSIIVVGFVVGILVLVIHFSIMIAVISAGVRRGIIKVFDDLGIGAEDIKARLTKNV